MLSLFDVFRLLLMGVLLILTFTGAGLYLRGFWIYFRTVSWLRKAEQAVLRHRYRSSALVALWREPELARIRTEFKLSLIGLPVFAISGACFNALQHIR